MFPLRGVADRVAASGKQHKRGAACRGNHMHRAGIVSNGSCGGAGQRHNVEKRRLSAKVQGLWAGPGDAVHNFLFFLRADQDGLESVFNESGAKARIMRCGPAFFGTACALPATIRT